MSNFDGTAAGLKNIQQLWSCLTALLKDLIGDVDLTKGDLQTQINNHTHDEAAKDKRDQIDDFKAVRTIPNSDGSITETDASGNTKRTVFNDDGSITETLKDADESVIATKTTTFNADGSIDEEVV